MLARVVLLLGVLAALTALWVVNCSGPQPAVLEVELTAPGVAGEPYRIAALVTNRGRGHGQVEVLFRLRERSSGRTLQEGRRITLEAGETALLVVAIPAPAGDYAPEVTVHYPPR